MRYDDLPFLVCLHLESGDIEMTPYRTYAEAQCVAALLSPFAKEPALVLRPKNVPFVYVFPPNAAIVRIEIRGPSGAPWPVPARVLN